MAEIFAGFGLTAAVLAIVNKTVETVQYCNTVKNTFKEQDKLQREIEIILPIVDSLRRKARKAKRDGSKFPEGTDKILSEMRKTLDSIDLEIEPRGRSKRLPMVLAWPFTKKDCTELLAELERLKTLMQLVLQQEVLKTVQEVKSDTSQIPGIKSDTSHIPDIQSKTDNIQKGVAELKNKAKDSSHENIIGWLSPCNFFSVQRDTASGRLDGSGQWFLDSAAFQSWLSNPGQTLWCSGMPGMGKTVLSSVVVDLLQQKFCKDDQVGVACVYCKWNESRDHTTVNLLAAIWMQLAYDSEISDDVRSLHRTCVAKGVRPDLSEVSAVLKSQADGSARIFIVVDALDECSNSARDILQQVQKIIPRLSLFVTSRNPPDKTQSLQNLVGAELEASQQEIRAYVETRVNDDHNIQALIAGDASLQQSIIDGVSSKTKGMFLLAKLHMDALSFEDNLRDLRRALNGLPNTLNKTYDALWTRISSQPDKRLERAKQIIAWVAYAARPLTTRELQCAIAIEPGDEQVEDDSLPDLNQSLVSCVGIVHVDLGTQAVRFVHETFQEYFMSSLAASHFSESPKSIALTCITCLSFSVMGEGRCSEDEELSQRLGKSPLLSYSARFWGLHARGDLENDKVVSGAIFWFLDQPEKVNAALQATLASETPYSGYSNTRPEQATALWVAIRAGLDFTPEVLLSRGSNIDQAASDGTTALSIAARYGSVATVQLLLDKKASLLIYDRWDSTPLHQACRSGRAEVISILLDAGVDKDATDRSGRTALVDAVTVSSLPAVQVLLRAGADTNVAGQHGWTALHSATRHNNTAMIESLFSFEAQVDQPTGIAGQGTVPYETALHVAAGLGLLEALKILLEHTKDVERRSYHGQTALHLAAKAGGEGAVRVLITSENKANIAAQDDNGMTALGLAVFSGHATTVQLLLENGCNADHRDKLGWSPLHLAARSGHCDIICLLLARKIDVNGVNDQGRTPTHEAALCGQVQAVELLLKHGADPTITSQTGCTPLRQPSILFSLPKLKPSTKDPGSTNIDVDSDRHRRIERVVRILWQAEKASVLASTDLDGQMAKLSMNMSSRGWSTTLDSASPNTDGDAKLSAYELAERLRITEFTRANAGSVEEDDGLRTISSTESKPLNPIKAGTPATKPEADPQIPKHLQKRIKLELDECHRDLPDGWTAGPLKMVDSEEYDLLNWRTSMIGPIESPYSGGVFFFVIEFPRDYPFKPMRMKFETRIYHPTMNSRGIICHDVFSVGWSPAYSIYKVMMIVEDLMKNPPHGQNYGWLNAESAALLATDRPKFESIARDWTRKYAC